MGLRTTGGRNGAAAARVIDRPSRLMGRVASFLDQLVVRMDIGPRADDPLAAVEPQLRRFLNEADGAACMHSSMPGRSIAALVAGGSPRYVLKIGQADDHPLRNEAEFLKRTAGMALSFRVPDLTYADVVGEHYVVATHAWRRARFAGMLTRNELLGITEVLATAGPGSGSLVHGDLAPWNILRTPEGIGVIDWETATFADQPLRDLIHYVVQTGAILRWTDVPTVTRELTHPRGLVSELARRLGLVRSQADEAVHAYFAGLPPVGVRQVQRFRDGVATAVGIPPVR
ncbi:phosphotransferase family protein [Streptomyces cellulosae]|uniref:Phosphotransferase family protein n=1 Tax=Streptomyces cellulosae TaxID=1968 RepID=A0ABW7Y4P5_STRCE